MAKQYKFAVTAPTSFGTRYIVSRHMTLSAAQKGAKGAKGKEGFEVIEL